MNYECYAFDTMEEMGNAKIPIPFSHIKSFVYVKEINKLYLYDNKSKCYHICSSHNTIINNCVLCERRRDYIVKN